MKPCQGLDTAPKIHPHNWQELACLMPAHADAGAEWSSESEHPLFLLTWDLFLSTWVQLEHKYQHTETRNYSWGQIWRCHNWGFILRRPEHLSCRGFWCLPETVSKVWYSDYIASFSRHRLYVLWKVTMKEDSNKKRLQYQKQSYLEKKWHLGCTDSICWRSGLKLSLVPEFLQ